MYLFNIFKITNELMSKDAADCCRIKLSMSKYGSHSALLLTKLCGDQDVWSGLDPGRDVQMLHKWVFRSLHGQTSRWILHNMA